MLKYFYNNNRRIIMKKFLDNHGTTILWFIFVIFGIISLGKLFVDGVTYGLIILIPVFIFIFPPIAKFILKKTRLKKIVFAVLGVFIISLTWVVSDAISSAQKAELQKINQEKKQKEIEQKQKEEEEKKKADEEKKNSLGSNQNKLTSESLIGEKTAPPPDTVENKQTEEKRNIAVRASKRSGYYYVPGQRYYNQIERKDLVTFKSIAEAKRAGYREYQG